MNKIILVGNLTRDPELKTTSQDIAVCSFSIAVNRRFGQDKDSVDYFPVTAWRGLAENCSKFLVKGNKVCVSGSLQIREYTTKEGEKRTGVEVQADDVEFLTPKGQSEGGGSGFGSGGYQKTEKKPVSTKDLEPVDDDEDNDIPF